MWTSGAHYCKRGLATVRTDFDVPKHQGITMVILDMEAPGVDTSKLSEAQRGVFFQVINTEPSYPVLLVAYLVVATMALVVNNLMAEGERLGAVHAPPAAIAHELGCTEQRVRQIRKEIERA